MLWLLHIPSPVVRLRRRPAKRSGPETDRSDEDLVRDARDGDASAFQEVVVRHQAAVFNVVLRTVNDPRAAEDITQDAFVRAWRSLSRFRGGNVRGWLMRIGINRAYDHLRSARRRPTDSIDALDYEPMPSTTSRPPTSVEDPQAYAARVELGQHLERLLAELPDDQRTALLLVDLQGFSYEETAGIMGVAAGTIKSRISRARSRLRDAIREDTDSAELFEHVVRQQSDRNRDARR